jgi:hypothetical protein
MSGAEMRERTLQELRKRIDLVRFRLNGRPGAPVVPAHDVTPGHFFFYPEQLPELAALLRQRFPMEAKNIVARAERICAHNFDLLGYEGLDYGPEIDWHLDPVHNKRASREPWYKLRYLEFDQVGDVKVTWELNRHQHLVTLAKAHLITRDERFANELFAQWYHWTEQNTYPLGINWVSSLEVAFRSLSWLWVRYLLAGSASVPQKFNTDLTQALGVSGRHIERYLSTFFSPNTHLLGEAVALFFIGTLCPELKSSARWKQRGWEIVLQEAERQIRSDGMHFEQSSYYHVYALDFFLHAMLLAARNDVAIPENFERTVEKMMELLCVLSRTGITHSFGDDDGGRLFDPRRNRAQHLADPLATGAVIFGRSDFKIVAGSLREETLWLLGAEGAARFDQIPDAAVEPRSVEFNASGLFVMADPGKDSAQLLIDAGPQGAHGHGHADALSVQLSQAGRAILIDPGTCEYAGSQGSRASFRGTAAHNTLQVDHLDQSQSKGPFSWERPAETRVQLWVRGENFDLFSGRHKGYEQLPSPVIHRRWIFYRKPDFWLVRDAAEGSGRHHLAINWHLAPGLHQQKQSVTFFAWPDSNDGIGLVTPAESGWEVKSSDGESSPVYGRKEPASVVQYECETSLPAELATVLVTSKTASGLGTLAAFPENGKTSSVVGYLYATPSELHKMFFASAQDWKLSDWSSDAEFLYSRENESGLQEIIFCNGSYVAFRGNRVASSRSRVESCELLWSGGARILSAQRELIAFHNWPKLSSSIGAGKLETAPPVGTGT